MGRNFQRCLGRVYDLAPGQYVADPETPSSIQLTTVLVRCPECGGVSSLDRHVIDIGGRVTPRWECPFATCSYREWLELESYRA